MPKHIVRLCALLAAALALGLAAKWYFTPQSFFRYGHYRGDSVSELAAREPAFQGARVCASCHAERHAQWSGASHKTVACETCHGAAQGHPQKLAKLPVPADARKLCSLCHERMQERPRTQPQVVVAEHAGAQQCVVCHNPHAPKLAGVVAKVAGDAGAGAKKHAASCASCHGASGISPNDTWPNLAGQNPAYLVRILAAYKWGDQSDVMMSPVAKTLSDTDIQDLAAFYAGLSCAAPAGVPAAGDAAAGKALSKNCTACHGETGMAANPSWPHIAGQKPAYLANALKAFRAGLRKDPTMASIARSLSDVDIANLTAFYATQRCAASGSRGKAG